MKYYTVNPAYLYAILADWQTTAREIAQRLIEKYVNPNEATMTNLIWYNNGIWQKTLVTNKPITINYPFEHVGYITNVIKYDFTLDDIPKIITYNPHIIFDFTKQEIYSRSDNEALNILNLNLMHEVIKNEKTTYEAKALYQKFFAEFKKGKENIYTKELIFKK